ncbi:MAG TPA: DUF1566 domain-containing protein [Kiritimatiellia bacterium]|nr:DUF1566 domain-containing protein [Kiritimatiellia bacterium]
MTRGCVRGGWRFFVLLALWLPGWGQGQDVLSIEGGYLTFANTDTSLYYRVEYRPNLEGEEGWLGVLGDLKNIRSSEPEVTVPVGLLYRVVGEVEPGGGGLSLPRTGQGTSYRAGDDAFFRAGEMWPSPRFTDHGNGTVTDTLTGLMWVKAPHGLDGNSTAKSWNGAVDFCHGLEFAGYSDWRLPNVRELQSLVDYGRASPALPAGHPFSGIRTGYYWTSSTRMGGTTMAWLLSLHLGLVVNDDKPTAYEVFPVRGGVLR